MNGDIYANGRYAQSNPDYHVTDSAWKAKQVRSLLDQQGIKPKSVVEIGCGAGEILRRLRDEMPDVTCFEGWDVSAHAIALCRARSGERLKFSEGDLLTADVPRFDLVLCLDVFEHVSDYLGFLSALKAKGQRFVFHVPLDLSVQSILRRRPLQEARARIGHLHYFTKETALASLVTAGYEIEHWRYTVGSLDLPDRSVLQRLARLPRRLGLALVPDLAVRVLGGCSLLVLAH